MYQTPGNGLGVGPGNYAPGPVTGISEGLGFRLIAMLIGVGRGGFPLKMGLSLKLYPDVS